jgi:hypothetical protein
MHSDYEMQATQLSIGQSLKSVTPVSLKVLIAAQGLAILVLGSWLYVEYYYASTFRNLLNDLVFSRALMWTTVIGSLTGLAGVATALGFRNSMQRMKRRIESLQGALSEASKTPQEKLSSTIPVQAHKEQDAPSAPPQPGPNALLVLPKKP